MATRDTIWRQMNAAIHPNPTIIDDIVKYCVRQSKTTGRTIDPFAEFIVPDALSATAFANWHTDEVRDEMTARMAAVTAAKPGRSRRAEAPWEVADEIEAMNAALDQMAPYFTASDENGVTLYRITDAEHRVIELCSPVNTAAAVSQAIKHDMHQQGLAATSERSRKLLDLYLSNANLIEKPVLWGGLDDANWCLARATTRPDAAVPFPHLSAFLDRLNDPQALCAYLWGIYSGAYKGRQILYVSDTEGENGKSSFFKAIQALFGDAVTASLNWRIVSGSTHASAHFAGKKLVVIGDNKNPAIIMSQSMKELSGDDMTMVNPKGLPAYSTYLECRPIISGNCEPLITSERHNQSRTLWLQLSPLQVGHRDPAWTSHYAAEMPGFLAYAQQCYAERCVNDYEIRVNDAVQQAVALRVQETESEFIVPFEDHLVLDPAGRLTDKQWQGLIKDELHWDKSTSANFLSWIERTFGAAVAKTTKREGRGYELHGIRLKKGREKSGTANATMTPKSYAGQGHSVMPGAIALPAPRAQH